MELPLSLKISLPISEAFIRLESFSTVSNIHYIFEFLKLSLKMSFIENKLTAVWKWNILLSFIVNSLNTNIPQISFKF